MNSPHDSRGSVARDTAAVCFASLLFVVMAAGSVLLDPAIDHSGRGSVPASPVVEPVLGPGPDLLEGPGADQCPGPMRPVQNGAIYFS